MVLPIEGSRWSFGGKNSPRPPKVGLLADVVRVRREVFISKSAPLEVRRVPAEALQPLAYKQSAGPTVDHTALRELDLVLQMDIGTDSV